MKAMQKTTANQIKNDPALDLGQVGVRQDERMKLVHTEKRGAVIRYLEDFDEWQVCFFVDGRHQTEADYHTDDELDALATARYWINC